MGNHTLNLVVLQILTNGSAVEVGGARGGRSTLDSLHGSAMEAIDAGEGG